MNVKRVSFLEKNKYKKKSLHKLINIFQIFFNMKFILYVLIFYDAGVQLIVLLEIFVTFVSSLLIKIVLTL